MTVVALVGDGTSNISALTAASSAQDFTFQADNFTGCTINVSGASVGNVTFTSVQDGTTLTGIGDGDSVTTASLSTSQSVTLGTVKYTGGGTTLVFTGTDLTKGTTKLDTTVTGGATSAGGVTLTSGDALVAVTAGAATAVTEVASGTILTGVPTGVTVTGAATGGMAVDGTVSINGALFVNAEAANSKPQFTATASGATLTSGTVKLDLDVSNGTNTTVTTTSGRVVTVTAGDGITVKEDGTIDGLNTGDAFTVDGMTFTVTTDPLDNTKVDLTVSGASSGNGTYVETTAGTSSFTVGSGNTFTSTNYTTVGDVTYQNVSESGATLAIKAITNNQGRIIFHNGNSGDGTTTVGSKVYGSLTASGTSTYVLAGSANMAALTSLTVDTSSLSSSITFTVAANLGTTMPSNTVYTNGSFSVTDVVMATPATGVLTFIGSRIEGTTTDIKSFTLSSGTVTLGDDAVAVKTDKGVLTVTEAGGDITTNHLVKVSSDGTVKGVTTSGTLVELAADTDATDDTNPAEITINTKTFSVVANKGAVINGDYELFNSTAGSLRVAAGVTQKVDTNGTTAGGKQSVKVTGGDGIILNSDGTFSDLEAGETVVVTDTSADSTITYSVSGTTLQISSVKTSTGAKQGELSYTMSESSVSFTSTALAAVTGAITPNSGEVETIATSNFGFATGDTTTTTARTVANGTYITKDGSLTLDSAKAVGQFTASDTTLTYTESATSAQNIVLGAPSTDYDAWSVTTSSGKDTISTTTGTTFDATISSGAGDDQINIVGNGAVSVSAGDGKDTIDITGSGDSTVDAGAGKDVITASGGGALVLNGGDGDNKITHTGAGDSTLRGGSGNDTISTSHGDDVIIGGGGKNTYDLMTNAAAIAISDFTYGSDKLQVANTGTASVLSGAAPTLFTTDGVVSLAAGRSADITGGNTASVYAATLVDGNGKNALDFGWTGESGGNINVSSATSSVVLIGSNNEEAADALYSGSGNDTLYGGSNDSLYGGAGKDLISLAGSTSGVVVGVSSTSGKDTVKGFTTGFEDADSIFLVDGSASNVGATLSGSTLTFKDGDGSLELQSISTNSTLGGAELLVSGAKVAVAAKGGTLKTDNINYANYYIGNGSAADFSSVEGAMTVNLANGLDSSAEGPKFKGITTVKGGSASTVLMGATAAESIVAGTGTTSLWGGAGKDTLMGGSGVDTFFIGSGDGADLVTGFTGGTDEGSDSVRTLANITGAKLTSSGVEISVGDSDKLTLQNVTANTAIKVNANGTELVAKVGSATSANNFTYDSKVSYYGGGNASDKIAFSSNYTENAEIWLDGSHGKTYASVDVVDGSNTSGNLIAAGDSSRQSLIGGKGNSSLWGGAGSASDTLRSSSNGTTMFWWGMGEGNDVAVSASANDSVNLYNVKLSDVDLNNTAITNSGVTLALNDGSKLTVQTSRDMTFTVDGTSWTANHSSKTWQQNS